MKPIRIFTPVFGNKFINLLDQCLSKSLLLPKNHELVKRCKWTFFLHPSEFDRIMGIASKVIPPEQIETLEADGSMDDLIRKRGPLMCESFVSVMRWCLRDNYQMLISTPDFFWSDGTIPNMQKLADHKNVCVSVPHIRTTPEFLTSGIKDTVKNAVIHPHRSWSMSEFGKHTGSFKGGILWRTVRPGVIAMQHRMPSPFLLNLLPEDTQYFSKKEQEWGAIDHNWAEALMNAGRWRYALSSDIGFMAEVTDVDQNVPPSDTPNPNIPDDFWTQDRTYHLIHQTYNRQFIASLRVGTE